MFNIFFHGSRRNKEISITFDDGPSNETYELLKILRKHKVKSTFFVLGKRIKGREDVIKKMKKEGHEFGNHTYSHKKMWFKSKKYVLKEIEKCDLELEKVGIKTNLFRFPYFIFDFNSLICCLKLKKRIIFSDVNSRDWLYEIKRKESESRLTRKKIISKVLSRTKNGSILNFHDYLEGIGSNREIASIIEEVIIELKEKGFEFLSVSELLFSNKK